MTRRYTALPDEGPADVVRRMMLDLRNARRQDPSLKVGVVQDAADELWSAVTEGLKAEELKGWEETIDRWHLNERLGKILRRRPRPRAPLDCRNGTIAWTLPMPRSEKSSTGSASSSRLSNKSAARRRSTSTSLTWCSWRRTRIGCGTTRRGRRACPSGADSPKAPASRSSASEPAASAGGRRASRQLSRCEPYIEVSDCQLSGVIYPAATPPRSVVPHDPSAFQTRRRPHGHQRARQGDEDAQPVEGEVSWRMELQTHSNTVQVIGVQALSFGSSSILLTGGVRIIACHDPGILRYPGKLRTTSDQRFKSDSKIPCRAESSIISTLSEGSSGLSTAKP